LESGDDALGADRDTAQAVAASGGGSSLRWEIALARLLSADAVRVRLQASYVPLAGKVDCYEALLALLTTGKTTPCMDLCC